MERCFSPANGILLVESRTTLRKSCLTSEFQSRERDSISWKWKRQQLQTQLIKFQSRERDSISWKASEKALIPFVSWSFSPANGILLVESRTDLKEMVGYLTYLFQSRERDSISWKWTLPAHGPTA